MKQRITKYGELVVIVTKDNGYWHLSVSHRNRYPTWDEIKDVRYKFLPNEITVGLLLPPKEEYVNVHPNCFHLWEVRCEGERITSL
jgi:hypothetical protein